MTRSKSTTPDRHASASSTDTTDSISPVLSAGDHGPAAGAATGYFTAAPVAEEPQTSPSLFGRLRRPRSRSPSARHHQPGSPPLGSPREHPPHPAHPAPVAAAAKTHRPRALHARSASASYPAGGPPSAGPTSGGSSMASAMGGAAAAAAAGSPRSRSRSGCQKRHSGTMMQVGRHGNDWLFGGFSITEKVRGMWSPSDESPRE